MQKNTPGREFISLQPDENRIKATAITSTLFLLLLLVFLANPDFDLSVQTVACPRLVKSGHCETAVATFDMQFGDVRLKTKKLATMPFLIEP